MDCKFCEFPQVQPDIYDAPETLRAHALYILESMELTDPSWNSKAREAARFASLSR